MTSFSWKRKVGGNLSKSVSNAFTDENEHQADDNDVDDWLSMAPKRTHLSLEDASAKTKRLKAEGMVLAESERYWEAILKWNEAIQLTLNDESLHEMKAQALLILCELYPAVQSAQTAVDINPIWWVSHQTLGRVHLGLGEVTLAIQSFSRAIHLQPNERELWDEDLQWATALRQQKTQSQTQDAKSAYMKIFEVEESTNDDKNADVVNELSTNETELDSTSNKRKPRIKTMPQNFVKMRDCV